MRLISVIERIPSHTLIWLMASLSLVQFWDDPLGLQALEGKKATFETSDKALRREDPPAIMSPHFFALKRSSL